jgi:hypothetical protein
MGIFQKKNKKIVLENEDKLACGYIDKIVDGKILTNDEIENILLMSIDNQRKILEYYNKTVYQFSEYIMLLNNK